MTIEMSSAAYETLDYVYDLESVGHENDLWDNTPAGETGGAVERRSYNSLLDHGFLEMVGARERANGYANLIRLTSRGRDHMKRVRELRGDRVARARACRDRLLSWYDRQSRTHTTDPGEFRNDERAWFYGAQFTVDEVEAAAEYLAQQGFLARAETFGGNSYLMNDQGRSVMDEGGLLAWLNAQSSPLGNVTNIEVNNHGAYAQVAAGLSVVQHQQISQQVTPGFEHIAEAMAEVLRRLPGLGLTVADREVIEEAVAEVVAEVGQPEPRPKLIRRALAVVKGGLATIAVGGLEGAGQVGAQELIEMVTGLPV